MGLSEALDVEVPQEADGRGERDLEGWPKGRRCWPERVLLSVDPSSGVWDYAMELARALQGAGVCFTVASIGGPVSEAQRAEAVAVAGLRLLEGKYALEWMEDPWVDVERSGRWLLEIAAEVEPDVVHLNGYCHAALDWEAPVIVGAHGCALSWWRAVHGGVAPARFAQYRERVGEGLARAELVVAPSAAVLDALGEHYRFSAQQWVIPGARQGQGFVPGRKGAFVFAAGRMGDEAVNLGVLVRAAPFLSWPLVVAGPGASVGREGVQWVGALEGRALTTWLLEAPIYAAPARYDPFGMGVMEAAHCGCALVLGDIPEMREHWQGAALFVPPDDEAAWCGTLSLLSADERAREELGARARARARQFSPRLLAKRYLAACGGLGGMARAEMHGAVGA